MSHRDFLLPDLGEGLTEGEVVSWLVSVGDIVEIDQNLAEIETAKAVVEVPSPFAGTVVTLHGEPGEEIAVGAPLITIDVGGDEAPEAAGAAAGGAAAGEEAAGEEASESGSVLVGYGTSEGAGPRRRRVSGGGGDSGDASGGGGGDASPAAPAAAADAPIRDGRPMAKPPVRKLAKDLGVDLDRVSGSGPDGIITRDDVQAAAGGQGGGAGSGARSGAFDGGVLVTDDEGHTLPSAPPNQPVAHAVEPISIPAAPTSGPSQERVKLNQMRRAISTQMARSRREIPEAVTWVEADATPLWELRKDLNRAQDEVKVSALAIIMRMAVAALRQFPSLNASLDTTTDEMVLHRHVNLGFAAQTDRGLVVPVIEGAQDLSILDIARALTGLADTARAGRLSPAQMSGGTFTISNYGAFGVDGGDMVINHPEAAILGTGRIVDKPWVVDGEVVVRKVITYSIAFDHRIIDGGEGAGFIRLLADMTENPTLMTAAL